LKQITFITGGPPTLPPLNPALETTSCGTQTEKPLNCKNSLKEACRNEYCLNGLCNVLITRPRTNPRWSPKIEIFVIE